MSQVIPCKSCKFYDAFYSPGGNSAWCNAPQLLYQIDFETGRKVRKTGDPERPQDVRSYESLCGREARWFQPMNIIDRLKRLF
jgi:hypothetical protein